MTALAGFAPGLTAGLVTALAAYRFKTSPDHKTPKPTTVEDEEAPQRSRLMRVLPMFKKLITETVKAAFYLALFNSIGASALSL